MASDPLEPGSEITFLAAIRMKVGLVLLIGLLGATGGLLRTVGVPFDTTVLGLTLVWTVAFVLDWPQARGRFAPSGYWRSVVGTVRWLAGRAAARSDEASRSGKP
jgi:hypothetical protein